MKPIRQILGNQKGAYFLMSAIVLGTMVGFAALGRRNWTMVWHSGGNK